VANPAGAFPYGIYSIGTYQMFNDTSIVLRIRGLIQKLKDYLDKNGPRKLKGNWTIEFEDDIQALYDVDINAELVSVISDEIVKDIDKEITKELLSSNG
jgi:hypothetical protein